MPENFKVGDKVKIKTKDEFNKELGTISYFAGRNAGKNRRTFAVVLHSGELRYFYDDELERVEQE